MVVLKLLPSGMVAKHFTIFTNRLFTFLAPEIKSLTRVLAARLTGHRCHLTYRHHTLLSFVVWKDGADSLKTGIAHRDAVFLHGPNGWRDTTRANSAIMTAGVLSLGMFTYSTG